jgi:sortase A
MQPVGGLARRFWPLVVLVASQAAAAEPVATPPVTSHIDPSATGHVAGSASPFRDWYDELPPPDMSDWSEKRIADYQRERALATESAEPEGMLRIPSINIVMPVFAGIAERHLTLGAGRIESTPPLATGGNTGLAAHRDGYFRALKDVRLNDAILVETTGGSFEYRVTELFVVDPKDVYVLDPTGTDSITIVTCYPFYYEGHAPERYIVRAEKR